MNRRALAANIPPMPNSRMTPAEPAEQLAAAMEAALDNGSTDHEAIQKWAQQVRELGRVIAVQRRDLLRHQVQQGRS